MSGGLDALETLGKKTMEALSEGDPGRYSPKNNFFTSFSLPHFNFNFKTKICLQ